MLSKVVYTTLLVSDQDKALDFYTKVLGFEKRADNPGPGGQGRFVAVGLPGQDFLLVLWPGTPGKPQSAAGPVPGIVVAETDDCRKAVDELRARGVEIEGEPRELPFGRIAIARDPDGNRLQLVERPKG